MVKTNTSGEGSAPQRESRDKTYHQFKSKDAEQRQKLSLQLDDTDAILREEMRTTCSLLVENARSTACSVLLPQQRNLIPVICFFKSILYASKEWCGLLVFDWSKQVVPRRFLMVIFSFSYSFGQREQIFLGIFQPMPTGSWKFLQYLVQDTWEAIRKITTVLFLKSKVSRLSACFSHLSGSSCLFVLLAPGCFNCKMEDL